MSCIPFEELGRQVFARYSFYVNAQSARAGLNEGGILDSATYRPSTLFLGQRIRLKQKPCAQAPTMLSRIRDFSIRMGKYEVTLSGNKSYALGVNRFEKVMKC